MIRIAGRQGILIGVALLVLAAAALFIGGGQMLANHERERGAMQQDSAQTLDREQTPSISPSGQGNLAKAAAPATDATHNQRGERGEGDHDGMFGWGEMIGLLAFFSGLVLLWPTLRSHAAERGWLRHSRRNRSPQSTDYDRF